MTATASTPTATAPAHARFRDLLHAEWTKFRTVRGWVITTVASTLALMLLGLFSASHSVVAPCSTGPDGPACRYVLPNGPGGEPVTDTYYLVHRALTGDGAITVRVTSLSEVAETGVTPQGQPAGTQPTVVPWAKAGLILTPGTGQGAAYAAVMVTAGHGTRMQWNYTGDTAGPAGGASPATPRWLRLTRIGDTITGATSTDGTTWTTIGTTDLPGLAGTVQVGMFVTSPGSVQQNGATISSASGSGRPTDATATFDHLTLTGSRPDDTWTGTAVSAGPDSPYVTGHAAGYQRTTDGYTITGSGDIAPDLTDSVPVDTLLVVLSVTLVALIVVSVRFITAEYRRGLIRTTMTASPRRGRVLAAKAIVLAAVTFATSLIGVGVTVVVGIRLLHAGGNPVYPTPPLTEARVVVGTAALTAVLAVFALAIGVIVRHGAAAVTVAVTTIILPYLLGAALPVLPIGAANWLLRLTPAAGFAVHQIMPAYRQVTDDYTPHTGFFPLPPWTGFAVTCAWAALALTVAGYLLKRRDA